MRPLILFCVGIAWLPTLACAAPTADIAKRCLRYAYIAYPFKRPGSAPMSGDRHAYIQNCFAKNGDVPVPSLPAPAKLAD
jgi:hypothetical protein